MEKRGLLLVAVLLVIISVFFVIAACPHGVTICGINYTCGNGSDGICPTDFGANCTDWFNSCSNPDPNCGITCAAAGASPAGNAACSASDPLKPYCCGNMGSGHCEACCNLQICNNTFAPAALPGAQYNTNGDQSCQGECLSFSCSPAAAANCINCSSQDGWYNLTPLNMTWANSSANICQLQRQVRQEFRDYTAVGSTCDYTKPTTIFRWGNVTGTTQDKTSGTICAVETGGCNADDTCISGFCTEIHAPNTTVCRPAVGVCDVAENCTGSSPACPADSFAPTTRLCNPLACSLGPGDNMYGSGGNSLCLGYCDGVSNSCDYANSCNPCAVSCTDSGSSFTIKESISLSTGCSSGSCATPPAINDYCIGNVVHDVTCTGQSQGTDLTYNCDNNDSSTCSCTAGSPLLNENCHDWDCFDGRCRDTGSTWLRSNTVCDASKECYLSGQNCQGNNYKCFLSNAGSYTWAASYPLAETACADWHDNNCNGECDYDNSLCSHGDIGCPVSIAAAPIVSNSANRAI